MIFRVRVVLDKTLVDRNGLFDNLCGIHFQSQASWVLSVEKCMMGYYNVIYKHPLIFT